MSRDEAVSAFLLRHGILRFTSIAMQQVRITYPSDAERRRSVVHEGFQFGQGDGHAFNCLSDSILQLLLLHNVVAQPLPDVASTRWQHEACEAVRLQEMRTIA